ncbi:MAG: hypothetical protein KDB26_08915 [Microthrixaceae bacterium]|nr:hypothetical protein [Microthrixaceae bacterium]
MAIQPGSLRDLAESPISYSRDDYDNPVADVLDGHLATLNADTSTAAGLQDELKAVIEEAVTEIGKLAEAQKRYDEAEIAEADADGPAAQRKAQKELREAKRALDEAEAEWETKKAELLAKLLDILQRAGLLGGGTGSPRDNDRWDEDDPTKPKPSSDKPGDSPSSDSPSSDSPGDNPSSDSPSGQTQLSADTATPTQQQQQAYPNVTPQQQQQPSAAMSPSAGMPTAASPSAFNSPRPRDKDKDKPRDIDADRGVLPVASPVPVATSVDRGSSVNGGVTTRDVSGKPSTSLSTSGQVPGAVNGQNPRGGVGGMVGGAPPPIGSGGKADTAGKRGGKRFDLESLFTKPDNDDQRVNSGSLSKDSISAMDKERTDEEDRMYRAMRESAKRAMEKKAG